MMEFFNETICVLLVVAITIIFVKTIYTHRKISSMEPFQESTRYYGLTENKSISDRILRDADFMKQIKNMYLKEYNERVAPEHTESKEALELAQQVKSKISSVPEKYTKILEKYNELNNDKT
jgi:hypothetical protein